MAADYDDELEVDDDSFMLKWTCNSRRMNEENNANKNKNKEKSRHNRKIEL